MGKIKGNHNSALLIELINNIYFHLIFRINALIDLISSYFSLFLCFYLQLVQ